MHKKTPELASKVERMKAASMTNAGIAYVLDIDEKTLVKYYKDEIKLGKNKILAAVSGKLIEKALEGDVASIFFYLKCQGGWKEKHEIQVYNLPRINKNVMEANDSE